MHHALMRLSPVLSPADLPRPELDAARLDGELFLLDGCHCPIDEPERPALRAGSLAARFGQRLIAERRSAAWVLGALATAPRVHQLCAGSTARVRPADRSGLELREVVIDEEDLLLIGGFRVTAPVRTVTDLARFSEAFGPEERRIVRRLARIGRVGLDDCLRLMNRRRNLPAKRRATQRLRDALG